MGEKDEVGAVNKLPKYLDVKENQRSAADCRIQIRARVAAARINIHHVLDFWIIQQRPMSGTRSLQTRKMYLLS